ncbi:MAG TPA: nitroreductase family protein [Smithella sp.]|nr:nitroreductase family protein [Smithella sp.]
MKFDDVLTSRRSIRKFRPGGLSEETVRQLLEAARLAPSGSNIQPARFIVAQSQKAREDIGRFTPYKFIVRASVIFVCCADLTALETRDLRVGELLEVGAFEGVDVNFEGFAPYSAISGAEAARAYLAMNVAIAVEHIVLKAVDLGLGSCWIGRFERDKVSAYLHLDENIYPVVLLPVGYPDQSPRARPRMNLDNMILKVI